MKLGGDFATWRVVHEGRVGSQKRRFHILWPLRVLEVRVTEIGIVLRALEGVGNGCLLNHN
jgi:hypothetical protein